MNVRVCFTEGKTRKEKVFDDTGEFTKYLDSNFNGKYPILRLPILFLLVEMTRGREFAKFENDLVNISFFSDTHTKDELKFDFFICVK